VIKVFEN